MLVSDKVNIWREIESDDAGLVMHDDLEGTTELLKKWISLPYNKRNVMKKNAKQCFLERFEIHKAAQSLIDVLRRNGVNG